MGGRGRRIEVQGPYLKNKLENQKDWGHDSSGRELA
jgi:hypothetical protein